MFDDHYPETRNTVHATTADICDALALHGYRPAADEPDPRPLPDDDAMRGSVAETFDGLATLCRDTCLEPELDGLLWGVVNLFHRKAAYLERLLDDNERAQRASQQHQDGSEIRSVELENLIAQGLALIDRRNGFEALRDHAGEQFETHTGSVWRPRAGSVVNHANLTASLVDSRAFVAARRRADNEVLMPKGTLIGFAGGIDCNDHQAIWAVLDRAHAKHPDIVLLHGATPKGAERIAACWADQRKVPQIAFRPDRSRHGKAAPFKRNDAQLDTLPAGIILFPGSGITDNLADKARKLGIPVWRCGNSAG